MGKLMSYFKSSSGSRHSSGSRQTFSSLHNGIHDHFRENGAFPPGTHPDTIRSFEAVDRDRSGFVNENELQQALSYGYQRFELRTIRLLIFIFNKSNDPRGIGPQDFSALWNCLGLWRGVFERYDQDRSGKIDLFELRDAFYGLGYALPPSVFKVLMANYDDGSNERIELSFDAFVECGLIIKGLTDKFMEKDTRRSGSTTFSYDEFLSVSIPFVAQYE